MMVGLAKDRYILFHLIQELHSDGLICIRPQNIARLAQAAQRAMPVWA